MLSVLIAESAKVYVQPALYARPCRNDEISIRERYTLCNRFTLTKLSPQSFGIIACQGPAAVRAYFSFDRTTLRARFLSTKFVAHFLASSAFVVPTFSYVLCFKQPPSYRTGIEKSPREKPVGKAKRRQERALLPIPPQRLAALISGQKDVYCSFL